MRYYEDEYILPKLASKRPTLYVSTQEPGRTWTGRIESSNLTYFFGPPSQTKIPSATGKLCFAEIETLHIEQGGFNFPNFARQKQVQRVLPKIFQLAATGCPFLAQKIWSCSNEAFIAYLKENVSQENWVLCHVLGKCSIVCFRIECI